MRVINILRCVDFFICLFNCFLSSFRNSGEQADRRKDISNSTTISIGGTTMMTYFG
jgi:hypothetical protein